MRKFWVSLVAAGLLAIAALAPAAAQESITIDLDELNDSGQSGTATLTAENGQTRVVIEIDAGEEDVEQPVHIHAGTCEDLGGVEYPLEDVVNGESETLLDVELADLMSESYAINVHLSYDEVATWVACGDIPVQVEDENGEVVDDDEEVADDEAEEEADDAEEALPAAGGAGANTGLVAMMLAIVAAAMAGVGLMVRRRSAYLKS